MRATPRTFRLVLAGLLLGAAPGCNKGHPITLPPNDSANDSANADVAPTEPTSNVPAPLAAVENARDLLPPGSLVAFEGKSFSRGIEIIDRDRLIKEIPAAYGDFQREVEKEFGYDVLVPENLRAMGIDPDGAAGAAWLSLRQETFAFYATLADPGRFRETVLSVAGRHDVQLHPVSLGGAEILRNKSGRLSVVIRGNAGYVVRTDEPKEGHIDYARVIATMNPSQSLTRSANFKKATMGYIQPDGLLYLNLASAVEQAMGDSGQRYTQNWASEELAEAKKRGAEAAEIGRLEQAVKDVDASNKRYAKERENTDEIVRMLFGDLGAIAFRGDVRKSGVMVEGRALLGPDAFIRTMFRNGEGKPPLLGALNGTPIFVNTATVEVEPTIDLIDRVARVDGMSWKSIVDRVRKSTNVDLNEDLRPNLTGAVGFGVALDPLPAKNGRQRLASLIGFTGHLEVKDAAKLDAALAKLGSGFSVDEVTFKKDKTGWVADIADYRKVYLGRAGNHLVVTTDPSVMGRLESGVGGTITELKPAGALAALSLENRAYNVAFGFSRMAGWFLLRFSDGSMSGMSPRMSPRAKSAKARRKRRQLAKVEKKMRKLETANSYERLEKFNATMEPFGISVAAVAEDDQGFSLQGGQFLPSGSIADLIVLSAKLVQDPMAFMQNSPELDETRAKFFVLQQELRDLEQKEHPHANPPQLHEE